MLRIGTTSFAWRYLLADPRQAPPLTQIVEQAGRLGLGRLQVCENARPLDLSRRDWAEMTRAADHAGVELQLGCMTADPAVLERHMEIAGWINCSMLRVVLEKESGPPTHDEATRFLDSVVPRLEQARMRLAVENHFDIPSARLAQWAEAYPAETLGFCVDSANSLRNFEPAEQVLRLLGPRALCYHLKDYRVVGSNVGFQVVGAPLGQGQFNVDGYLSAIFASQGEPQIFLETWTPASGDRRRDVETDAAWLAQSLENLVGRLGLIGKFSSTVIAG